MTGQGSAFCVDWAYPEVNLHRDVGGRGEINVLLFVVQIIALRETHALFLKKKFAGHLAVGQGNPEGYC